MGIEFIRRAAPSFRKGLDRMRIALATPTLFTQQPACTPQAYAANLEPGYLPMVGDRLGVRLDGERVLVLRGLHAVGTFSRPTVELVAALRASHGEACGLVHEVHDIACIAEISVC
jgi:hypothetical protein